jgi:hypothetical protein
MERRQVFSGHLGLFRSIHTDETSKDFSFCHSERKNISFEAAEILHFAALRSE